MFERSRLLTALAATLALAGAAQAQPFISEMLINPQSDDNGAEFIELQGPAGESLAGYWFIVIEGDGSPSGVVDQKIDLSAYTFGSNGLVLIRDADAELSPPPAKETNVYTFDFVPDIENGTNSYILGKGRFAPNVGDDLDVENDGVIDAPVEGFTAVDAVSYTDGGAGDAEYADDFGGKALGAQSGFTPQALYRILEADGVTAKLWAGGWVDGINPGPFFWHTTNHFGWADVGIADPSSMTLDPGSINFKVGGEECYADCDQSGELDIDDFICFQTAFGTGDAYADCDLSGELDIDDFICFQTAFGVGCP